MATGIYHAFTVTASDVGTAGIVHPADWLADHVIEAGTVLNGMPPIGAILPFAGLIASVPSGWKFCNGDSLLRAGTYAGLFTAIGDIYGAADGSHFNLPNLVDKFVVGAKQDDTVPKSNIRGTLEQTGAPVAVTLTHGGVIANHTMTHAGFSVGNHPALTHAAIVLADHPSTSMTIGIGDHGTITQICVTTVTKTASRGTVVTASRSRGHGGCRGGPHP